MQTAPGEKQEVPGAGEAADQSVFIEAEEEGYTVPTQARWVITDHHYTNQDKPSDIEQ